jgi:RNA 2',3'-cyclic 3'-phosphodiesterase
VARLFVAVWPPAPVVDVIAALPRPSVDGLRWTVPEQWHVTMRFFGEAGVDEAVEACRQIDAHSCVLTLGPRVRRLGRGVIIAPVRGLDDLAGAVTAATRDIGRPPEDRPFHGHITVARAKRRCALIGEPVAATWTASTIALVRSDLHPRGARYTTVGTFPLR